MSLPGRRRVPRAWLLGALALLAAAASGAAAHEARPAFLEISEIAPGRYDVLWRTPRLSGQRLPVALELPQGARDVVPPGERVLADSVVERRVIDAAPAGLAGRRIAFPGLELTITDVLVRFADLGGGYATALVRPSQPWVDVPAPRGWAGVAGAYLAHGVEHILLGIDHLLFVLGLMLIVRGTRRLVLTITAFTIAHSVTLGAATLGYVHVPGPPVEAAIALSILVLAVEIARMQRGERSVTAERPWAVAFAFGLLHGLGFAGALAELGLPQSDIPLALLAFNVGVEAGQLVFVAAVLGLLYALRRVRWPGPAWTRWAPAYGLGAIASFWLVDRLSGFAA